ncbi:MAG: oligosaccharide flippase family protein, partial [Candidatus Brocadia sp.]
MKLLSLKKTQKFYRAIHAYELFTNKRSKQIFSLYTSTILGLMIGIGVSVVNTRMLGEKQFGDLKFLQSLFMFVATTINFGVFATGGRLLAQSKDDAAKPYLVGNIILMTAVIVMLQIIILLIYSYVPINVHSPEIGKMIRMFSPLLFVFPFQMCFENLMQGDNRIYELSFFRLLPSTLFLFTAIIVNYYIPVHLELTLLMQFGILAVVIIGFIFKFKPRFNFYRQYWPVLFEENKRYGFPVYIGVLAGVATTQAGTIAISYLIDNVNLGYFSLAITISMPLSMIPSV